MTQKGIETKPKASYKYKKRTVFGKSVMRQNGKQPVVDKPV